MSAPANTGGGGGGGDGQQNQNPGGGGGGGLRISPIANDESSERHKMLVEKKRKLEELRKNREAMKSSVPDAIVNRNNNPAAAAAGPALDSTSQTPLKLSASDLRALINETGIQAPPGVIVDGDIQNQQQQPLPEQDGVVPQQKQQMTHHMNNGGIGCHPTFYGTAAKSGRPMTLEVVPGPLPISIPPKNEAAAYCKTTQTDDRFSFGEFSTGSQEDMAFDEMSLDDETALAAGIGGLPEESPSHDIRKTLKSLQFLQHSHLDSIQEVTQTPQQPQPPKMPELSEEEKRRVLASSDFMRFFQRQSRVIERALAEEVDIFTDYTIGGGERGDGQMQDTGELLVMKRQIANASTANRSVRAMSFSPFQPELVAVAYDRLPDESKTHESIVHVWNTHFKTQPEMTFLSSSVVTAICYDEFQPNILIGGCYSGQICIWDSRANKRIPSLKAPLSQNAHTQPVYCMQMVGTTNAHDLVTVSTDGRLCSWSPSNLQQPIDSVNLTLKTKKQVSALCMSFFDNNINTLVIGGEEGDLYIADRHGNKGEVSRTIQAHALPLTSVHMHPGARAPIDFSSLCLSASMDFGVRMWNLKDMNLALPLLDQHGSTNKFYMGDAQWHPAHPAVFATTCLDGTLSLWNLNANSESPLVTQQPSDCLSKLKWSRKGNHLVAGDELGNVFLYEANELLHSPRNAEWENFARVVKELNEAAWQQQRDMTSDGSGPGGGPPSLLPAELISGGGGFPSIVPSLQL